MKIIFKNDAGDLTSKMSSMEPGSCFYYGQPNNKFVKLNTSLAVTNAMHYLGDYRYCALNMLGAVAAFTGEEEVVFIGKAKELEITLVP